MCFNKCPFSVALYSHWSQGNLTPSCLDFMCFNKCPFWHWVALYLHWSQGNLTPLCLDFMCLNKSPIGVGHKETWHLHVLTWYDAINLLSLLPCNHIGHKETWHLHVLISCDSINVPSELPYNHIGHKESWHLHLHVLNSFIKCHNLYKYHKDKNSSHITVFWIMVQYCFVKDSSAITLYK